MVTTCVICRRTKTTNNNELKKISFHRFPLLRPEVLEKWLLFVGLTRFSPKNYHRVCSDHFTENSFQFRPVAEKRLLKEDAVPTLYPYPYWSRQSKFSSSLSSCPPVTQEPLGTDFEPLIENNMVIVSDRTAYENVLNSHTDANRRIVISDTSSLKEGSGSSLADIYQASSGSSVIETYDLIGLNAYKNDALVFCDNKFHAQRMKELEEVVKTLHREKRRWQLKIRRGKVKFKKLRKEFFQYTRKDEPLLRCNSQPMVHFLTLDEQNT